MADTPDFQSADWMAQSERWAFVDTILGGTVTMRAAAETMLPQFPAEHEDTYTERVESTTFDNDYADTLDGIVGMVFRRPAQPADNVPAQIQQHLENIDLAGTAFNLFAPRFFRKGVHYGAAYILIDMQKVGIAGPLDDSEAAALNLRPYWIAYGINQVQSRPRYVCIRGAKTLQQIVFRVCDLVPDGLFGEREVIQYRVWRLPVALLPNGQYEEAGFVEWQIWEQRDTDELDANGKKKQEVVLVDFGSVPNLTGIPVAPFIANPDWYNEALCTGPTLYDLADLCRKDYGQQSDHEANLHVCNSPVPFTVNLKDDGTLTQQPWGKGVLFNCSENGMVGYAEPAGTGLQAMERQLAKNKDAIRKKGLEMVVEGGDVQTTATEQLLRASKRSSRLSLITDAIHDCFERALQFHAQWLGLGEDAGGEITMGVKGDELILTAQDVQAYSAMVAAEQMSLRTFWGILRRGGVTEDDFDPETELDQIAEERGRVFEQSLDEQIQRQDAMPPPEPAIMQANA